jgi:Glycosyl transferase family 2
MTTESGRVCTVTTLKDTPENAVNFVHSNLAAGADHMFVFVDDADPAVMAALSAEPHVTAFATDGAYWQGHRPLSLNTRQISNADLVNHALAVVPSVRWLFHLDGDECLYVDRDALLALEAEVESLRLLTLEAVSRLQWNGPVTHFKRILSEDDLCLLAVLGVIEEPDMKSYFRGHQQKPGMRPSLRLRLRLHHVENRAGKAVRPVIDDRLRVLHYESHDGEEFVRKWLNHLDNGKIQHRGRRDWLRNAIRSVAQNPALDEPRRREVLLELYRRSAQDDFATLEGLGFLVQLDESRHEHHPTPFEPEDTAILEEMTTMLGAGDKRYFVKEEDEYEPATLLRAIRAGLADETDLAARLDDVLGR